jgi:hypothetical protein
VDSTRRDLVTAIALGPLIARLSRMQAWARPLDPSVRRWILRVGEIGHAVQSGRMTPRQWQDAMQETYAAFRPEEFVRFINMDHLLAGLTWPTESLGAVKDVAWPKAEGFPADLRFGHKLFVYRKGSCTPPHCHNHLVSAHWILRGEVRTRTFNRVEDLETAILLEPTRDEISKPGALVTMFDARDNAHWFEGVSEEPSISFDIPIWDITPDKTYRHEAEGYNQIFLDPTVAPRPNGKIEAPIIKFEQSKLSFG